MTFDLSSLPDEIQPLIREAIEARNSEIALTTEDTRKMIQSLLLEIADSLGTGTFTLTDDISKKLEQARQTFATNIDDIIATGTLEVISSATGIGAAVLTKYLKDIGSSTELVKFTYLERAKKFAKTYAQDTARFYSPGTKWKLSSRIWDLSGDNLAQIQKILKAGEGTDAVQLAKALRVYIKKGSETFAEQYPNLMNRMEGRITKSTSYEALRLARNELSEAYWEGALEGYRNNEAITGVKMLLSNSHPKKDICDTLTTEDTYGLGPGCFPVEFAPDLPHVCCLCCLIPLLKKDNTEKAA
jgi:hypothetical protein